MKRAQSIARPVAGCRRRVLAFVKALPEAEAVPMGEGHLSLEVRGRRFGWFLQDHHGDGRIAVNLKAPPGAGQRLVRQDPERFHVPKHLGHHGWIGVWLDSPKPDWPVVRALIIEAYLLAAPRRLTNLLRTTKPTKLP